MHGWVTPDGVRHRWEAFRRTPGMPVVPRPDPERLPRPGDPLVAVCLRLFCGHQLGVRTMHEDAAVGEGVDAAIVDSSKGIGRYQGGLTPRLALVLRVARLHIGQWIVVVGITQVWCSLEEHHQITGRRANDVRAQGVHAGFVVYRQAMGYFPAHHVSLRLDSS